MKKSAMRGNGLRVHFKALENALIEDLKTPKRQNDVLDDVLADRIIDALLKEPTITQITLAKKLDVSYRTLQRKMNELKHAGRIERVGGKRYGCWKAQE